MNFNSNRRNFLKGSASLSLVTASPTLKAMGSALSPADSSVASHAATIGHPLLAPNLAHSLAVRCLSKPVLATNILDNMETDKHWAPSPVVQLSYTNERAKSGTRSLRFTTLMRNEEFIRASRNKQGSFSGGEASFLGQPFSAFAALSFDKPQDWTAFNRISLWCYLHPTVTPTTSLSLQFLCAGATAGPWDPLPIHFINDLKPGEWNHLTWEISEYPRNQVVAFFLMKPTSGLPLHTNDPSITYDIDQLSLERVEVEPVSSWQVTPGKIAYSHFGYRPSARKLAFCSEPDAHSFQLVNAETNAVVHEFPVTQLSNARGHYAVLDFTAAAAPGMYRLHCGTSSSEGFP
ncbi:MAG: cellulase N-terminal Ig-like domain-containing protein, partial [Solirubrobacteraceae bacterium]